MTDALAPVLRRASLTVLKTSTPSCFVPPLPGVTPALDLVVAWGLADFATPADIPAAIEQADKAMYICKIDRKAAG